MNIRIYHQFLCIKPLKTNCNSITFLYLQLIFFFFKLTVNRPDSNSKVAVLFYFVNVCCGQTTQADVFLLSKLHNAITATQQPCLNNFPTCMMQLPALWACLQIFKGILELWLVCVCFSFQWLDNSMSCNELIGRLV